MPAGAGALRPLQAVGAMNFLRNGVAADSFPDPLQNTNDVI